MDQYESAKAEADHLAELMRAALTRAGVPGRQVQHVRGRVGRSGLGYVEFGALRVCDVVRLLDALPQGRTDIPRLCADASG